MKQKEKELLIKDLCARLPYGVKALYCDYIKKKDVFGTIEVIYIDKYDDITDCDVGIIYWKLGLSEIKPCLFPLSSMTEEQKDIYCQLQQKVIYNSKGFVTEDVINYINWCYKNHLDINDLIPKGLAIDATGLNIY